MMANGLGVDTMGAMHCGADFMAEQEEGKRNHNKPEQQDDESIFEPEKLADDDDDARELQRLRERRLEELKASRQPSSARFGNGVKEIQQTEWAGEVVEASKIAWVVVHLYREENPFSKPMLSALNVLSAQQPASKFVQINAMYAIPPDKYSLLPALFCYRDGKLSKRLIGKEITRAGAPSAPGLEWMLAELGVLETELEGAPPVRSGIQRAGSRQRDVDPEVEIDYGIMAEMD